MGALNRMSFVSRFRQPIAHFVLCLVLIGCAPPASVPRDAATSYDWYNGHFTYTWRRPVRSGCALWMATERWADVRLLVESRCEELEERFLEGRGVTYFSPADHLIFRGYWSWTSEDYLDLMEFDSEGMISRIRACPHSLTSEQLNELRSLVRETLSGATTDAERRVLNRISERLAATNGNALSSGQQGCTDLPPDWYRGSYPEQDPWTPR
jgi:hypothetical protein